MSFLFRNDKSFAWRTSDGNENNNKTPGIRNDKNKVITVSAGPIFFGFLVPIFRGELGVGALHALFSFLTLWIWQFVFCFLFNKSRFFLDRVGGSDSGMIDCRPHLRAPLYCDSQ